MNRKVGRFFHGVRIVNLVTSTNIVLCSDCFETLLDQLGGWKNIDSRKIYPLQGGNYHLFCGVCNRPIIEERRSGADRRFYDYGIYLPERRLKARRKTDTPTLH